MTSSRSFRELVFNGLVRRTLLAVTSCLAAWSLPLAAQQVEMPPDAGPPPASISEADARAVLALPVDDAAPLADRIALLVRQRNAARRLGDQGALLGALRRLSAIGRDRPEWASWTFDLFSTEFIYGSQQKGIDIGEMLLVQPDLQPGLRSNAAAGLAWKYCDIGDRRNCERVFALAEAAYGQLPATMGANDRDFATVEYLQARSERLRTRGDLDGRVAALREALVVARRRLDRIASVDGADFKNARYRSASNTADYAAGQLIYALVDQGRSAEGVAVAQDGLSRARVGNLGADSIGAWNQRLATALIGERRYDEGLVAARASLASLAQAGVQPGSLQMAVARNAEVVSLINLERWQEADQAYSAFLASIRGDRAAYDRSYNSLLLALLAAKNNRFDDALKAIDIGYRARARIYGKSNYLTTEAQAIRGAIYLMTGSPRTALADYEDFFTNLLESPTGWTDLSPSGARGAYLNIVLTEYLRYAKGLYAAGGSDAIDRRMFSRLVQVSDRLGSGAAQRSILESVAKVTNGDPDLVALLGQEQELRGKVREAYALAFADVAASDAKDTPDDRKKQLGEQLKQHRDAAETAQKQLDEARARLSRQFPTFLQLVNPVNPNADAIRKVLLPGEAFVGIYPSREGTFVFAIAASGKTAFAVSPWTDAEVARRVALLRKSLDVGDQLPRLPPMDFAAALSIHDELIKPVRAALAGVAVLDISAGGALASLPFAALVSGPAANLQDAPWLVREFAIAQTPGAAAFVTLRNAETRSAAAQALIGFGDPLFRLAGAPTRGSPPSSTPRARNLVVAANAQQASTYTVEQGFRYASIPALPETREELVALAGALGADPARDLVLGAAATRRSVLTTPLADRRVVAFATHGLLPGEIPTLSKPALAMAATDDANDSPLLSLDDVLTLKLNAQWVVLSACNTAGGERDGAAMSGLVRGFFFAGTRSVLATQWAVESEASRQLVVRIFAGAAKDPKSGRAASLRLAQLAMIDGSLGDGAYAHPFFWAPYTLFGDPLR